MEDREVLEAGVTTGVAAMLVCIMCNFMLELTLCLIRSLNLSFLILQVDTATIREDGTTQTLGITAKEAGVVARVVTGVVIRGEVVVVEEEEEEEAAGATRTSAVTTNRVTVGARQGTNNTAITALRLTT